MSTPATKHEPTIHSAYTPSRPVAGNTARVTVRSTSSGVRRSSPIYTRWHFRHAATIALFVRVLASAALFFAAASGAVPGPPAYDGARIGVLLVVTSVVLAALDRRRAGGAVLLANLGYSQRWLLATSIIPALLIEITVNVLAAFA